MVWAVGPVVFALFFNCYDNIPDRQVLHPVDLSADDVFDLADEPDVQEKIEEAP